jgi:hypothetical protein
LAPLTIANGVAQVNWAGGTMEGQITPQGLLTMHAPNGSRFEGQIDSRSLLKGRITGWYCTYELTWQKKP